MAAIDKIYGTKEQHREFLNWARENNPALEQYFYPFYPERDGVYPITNFPIWADAYLWDNCPLDWVKARLEYQYEGQRPKLVQEA